MGGCMPPELMRMQRLVAASHCPCHVRTMVGGQSTRRSMREPRLKRRLKRGRRHVVLLNALINFEFDQQVRHDIRGIRAYRVD